MPGAKDNAVLDNKGVDYTVSVTSNGLVVSGLQGVAGNTLSIGAGDEFTVRHGTNGGAFAGAVQVGDGSVFNLGASNIAAVTFDNAGSIALSSVAGNSDLHVSSPSTTLSGAGTVTMSGPRARIIGSAGADTLTNVDNTIVGTGFIGVSQMTLINDAAGVIDATGAMTIRDAVGQTLTNAGLIEADVSGKLSLVSETINQSAGGTISAAGLVGLQAVDIVGGTLTTTGTGRINVNGGGATLDGSTSAVTNSGLLQVTGNQTLTANGAITNSGKFGIHHGTVVVGAAGVVLSGAGQVNLNNNANNAIVGSSATVTLENVDNRIDGAGKLGEGSLVLINDAAGVIIGNQKLALTIDTGVNVITNAGVIENAGTGGTVVDSAVLNTGTLKAVTAGTLTLAGAVTGVGVGQINGGTLNAEAAFTENVAFSGTTGVLKLADSQDYTGTITGFSKTGTTTLDLADITFGAAITHATYTGTSASGVLTVTDGTHTANFNLTGNYLGETFAVSGDGKGGTRVVAHAPVTRLTSAMAAFASGAGTGVAPHMATARLEPLMIAAR